MIRITRWKVALVALATLFGVLFTLPNFLPADVRAKWPGFLPSSTLNLGLDLQGGSYLLYQVDTPALIKERLTNIGEDMRKSLHDAQIPFQNLTQSGNGVNVDIVDPAKIEDAYQALVKLQGQVKTSGGGTAPEFSAQRLPGQTLRLAILDQAIQAETASAVDQSIQIINKRINGLGTKEPSITRQGSDRIVIEAAGESNPERLKALIGQTAKLSFQMVDDTESAEEARQTGVPPGSEILPGAEREPFVLVRKQVAVSGEMLTDARLEFDPQTNEPAVGLTFNGQGASRFGRLTADNVGRRFAIVLDNKVLSAPVIRSAIPGGTGQISGSFTPQSAGDLALLLRSGSLPAPLKVIEQNTVGPDLGAAAIRAGAISLAVGAAAIFVFIILAYGLFGVFAAVALIINVLMILGLMSATQATLTLPGIAGVILTLAVAVDANVLVYERMRDEARAGHAPMLSADHGFKRAMISIFDANVTTLIAAGIMFQFGSGPVKGFAWTLAVGVITSVFTALLVTQVLIGWWFKLAKPKQLPI
jgi:preprotein translocase subunit SecD